MYQYLNLQKNGVAITDANLVKTLGIKKYALQNPRFRLIILNYENIF